MDRVSMSVTAKGKRWELLHSLWIGWTLFTFGFLGWIAFLYIGIRTKQRKWILWAVLYAVPLGLAFTLNPLIYSSTDVPEPVLNGVTALTFAIWGISIIHAFKARKEYLMRLEAVQLHSHRQDNRQDKLQSLKQQLANEYQLGQQETLPTQREKPAETSEVSIPNPGQDHLPRPTSEEPDASSDQPPEVSPSQEPVPPLVAVDDTPRKVVPERLGTTSIPTDYPLPLAYAYRLADAEFETFRVLKELYRNAEGLTAFLASLALVLAPTPTGKRKDTLLWAWRGKGATFGKWYAILEKITPTIDEDEGHLYRSMQQLLGTKANPSSFAETMTWLIDRRNDLHHGDLPVGPRADLLIQEVRSRFEHCVSESAALWQHPLRLVLDYDAVRNND
jgi:hypothetical protein